MTTLNLVASVSGQFIMFVGLGLFEVGFLILCLNSIPSKKILLRFVFSTFENLDRKRRVFGN